MTPDHLGETSRPVRWGAIALLMFGAAVSSACLAACVAVAIVGAPGMPVGALWGNLAIFAVLAGASVWMLVRLLRKSRARNGRTTMPVWFIQAFGALMLAGITFVAVAERQPWLLVEEFGVGLAMFGIRQALCGNDESGMGNGK